MKLSDIRKPKELSNMHETAEFMGISYMTLYRMVKGGKIGYVNIAKTGSKEIFAFRPEDIQAYYDHIPQSKKSFGKRNPETNIETTLEPPNIQLEK